MIIAIYTHSDYFDILTIQLDYFQKIFKDSCIKICVFSNKVFDSCVYETVIYDESLPYASRLLECLEKIQSEYVLIIHENDILLKYNEGIIDLCINIMKRCSIDSLDLKHFTHGEPMRDVIPVTETLFLNRKSIGFIYNVQPTLWNVDSFKRVLREFSDKTYRSIECDEINHYILTKCNAYILADLSAFQSIFYKVSDIFVFIHITSCHNLIPCHINNNIHESIQKEHENIYNTYLVNNTRRKFCNYILFQHQTALRPEKYWLEK
jgi:hypothetical protein